MATSARASTCTRRRTGAAFCIWPMKARPTSQTEDRMSVPVGCRSPMEGYEFSMERKRRSWTQQEIVDIYRASAGKCRECNRKHRLDGYGRTWNVDHVIPFSKNGRNAVYNLALTCIQCNTRRGNRSNEGDIAETAARRAVQMERNLQGGRRNSGQRNQGSNRNRGGRGGSRPKIHITAMYLMEKTRCGLDASQVQCGTPMEATCKDCQREEQQDPFTFINRQFT